MDDEENKSAYSDPVVYDLGSCGSGIFGCYVCIGVQAGD